ncbi:GNAT family N-acetyltransferase [Nocardiopsis aegyptia]|uniref:GNAT family N-acetyltransferase n=1 Tax=Nocardiopsis aegyptia TaxID=220378 RepID=UPI00367066E2
MTQWKIRSATPEDMEGVVDLLNYAADQLRERGISQWRPGWMNSERMLPMIERGETFVVHDAAGNLIATVSLNERPDPDFWTPDEQKLPSLYLSKLAGRVSGVGEWVLDWAVQRAYTLGYEAVRLDAWATNTGLHRYYRERGWVHLRTMRIPGRNSGALFEFRTRASARSAQ